MKKVKILFIFILIPMSLVFASYFGINAGTKFRDSPQKLNIKDIKTLVKNWNFFDKELNGKGDFSNDFVDNGNGTVTDRSTGLMWEQKGSKKVTSFYSATKHVKKLNKKKFAGYDDWRIPTVEELYSLTEPNTNKQLYINPVFAATAYHCWSADTSDLYCNLFLCGQRKRYLTLDYKKGTVSDAFKGDQPGGASATNFRSFIRAVRSLQ